MDNGNGTESKPQIIITFADQTSVIAKMDYVNMNSPAFAAQLIIIGRVLQMQGEDMLRASNAALAARAQQQGGGGLVIPFITPRPPGQ